MDASTMQRALALFEEIADLDAISREHALDAVDDAQVRAAVQALLQADARVPASPSAGSLRDALLQETDADGPLPGQRVGNCTLVRLLGRGGMGEVWEARRDQADFSQRVAVKLLHDTMAGAPARQRFAREQRVLARLDHPAIARLLDAGVEAGGRAWLVLEYVDGVRIDRYVAANQVDRRGCVALVARLCRAVEHAHRHLVLHRDIKPANVLVDGEGSPHLLDFGIARLLDEDEATVGGLAHTPRYAAPEQLRGEPPQTATDVFQLGLLLGELLLGRTARDLAAAQWRRRLDADLAAIVLQSTADAAGERYPSAQALGDDLECWRQGRPVQARPARWSYRVRRFVGRHRAASGFAALAAIALGAGVAGVAVQARQAREAQRAAEAAALRAEDEAAISREVSVLLSSLMSAADPSVANRPDVTAREVLLSALESLQKRGDIRTPIRTRLTHHIASALNGVGELAAARGLLERAVADGGDPVDLAFNLRYLAVLERGEGNFTHAATLLDQAIGLTRDGDPRAVLARIGVLTERGLTEAWQGRYAAALPWQQRAQALAAAQAERWPEEDAYARHNLAQNLIWLNRYDEAARWLDSADAAVARDAQRFAAMRLRIAETRVYLLNRQHRYADALGVAEAVLPELRAVYGPGNHRERQLRQHRARALDGSGRHGEARRELTSLLAELQSAGAGLMPRMNTARYLMDAQVHDGAWADLAALARRLLGELRTHPEAQQPREETQAFLAYALLRLGRPVQARDALGALDAARVATLSRELALPGLDAAAR